MDDDSESDSWESENAISFHPFSTLIGSRMLVLWLIAFWGALSFVWVGRLLIPLGFGEFDGKGKVPGCFTGEGTFGSVVPITLE